MMRHIAVDTQKPNVLFYLHSHINYQTERTHSVTQTNATQFVSVINVGTVKKSEKKI